MDTYNLIVLVIDPAKEVGKEGASVPVPSLCLSLLLSLPCHEQRQQP